MAENQSFCSSEREWHWRGEQVTNKKPKCCSHFSVTEGTPTLKVVQMLKLMMQLHIHHQGTRRLVTYVLRLSAKTRAGLLEWPKMAWESPEMRLFWSFYGGGWVGMQWGFPHQVEASVVWAPGQGQGFLSSPGGGIEGGGLRFTSCQQSNMKKYSQTLWH